MGNIDTDDVNKWRTKVTELDKNHRLKNTQLSFYASTTNKDMGKEVQWVTKKGRSMALKTGMILKEKIHRSKLFGN